MAKSNKNAAQKIDLYFILLLSLTYLFAYVIRFVAGGNDTSFIIMLNVLFILIIVSFFSSIMVSLVACFLFVFGYGSFILYEVVIARANISTISYFWIVLIPLGCIVTSFFRTYLLEVQERIMELSETSEQLMGFDEKTNTLNERMFHYELMRYMAMAKRGYIKLCLFVIKVKYYDDILRLVGRSGMDDLFRSISTSIDSVTRVEDVPFFVGDKGVFSLIVITDLPGAIIIKNRLIESIRSIDLQDKIKTYNLTLELKIGIAEYTPEITNTVEFRQMAEKDMEYDV